MNRPAALTSLVLLGAAVATGCIIKSTAPADSAPQPTATSPAGTPATTTATATTTAPAASTAPAPERKPLPAPPKAPAASSS